MVYYGLCLFLFLEYARPAFYFPALMPLHLNSIVPTVVAIKSLLADGRPSNSDLFGETTTRLVFSFLGLIALSVVVSDVQEKAWAVFTAVLGYSLIYAGLAKQLTDIKQIKGIFKVMLFVHVVTCAMNPEIFGSSDRLYLQGAPFLGDGNDFALSVNVVIPLGLFLFFDGKGFVGKVACGAVLLLFLFGIVATQSRGGTLALGAVAIYYWCKSDRKGVMAAIAAVAVVGVMALAPPQYFERMNDVANTEEGSAAGRIAAWTASTQMALSYPLFGVGAGQFAAEYGARFKVPSQTAHSIYFLVLGELGFPGLIVLIAMIVSNLVANRGVTRELRRRVSSESQRHARLLAALSASLIAYVVAGAFLSATYYPHMYIILGLLVASRRLALQANESEAEAPAQGAISYHWALRATMASGGASRYLRERG